MLGKLLKYDLRSVSRLLVPATLLAAAVTILGTVALRLIIYISTTYSGGFVATAAIVGLVLIVVASVVALIAYSVVSVIFIYVRFYKNLFTDEGYLTFTLPVKSHSLLLSKLITYAIWGFITAFAVFAFILIFVLVGCATPGQIVSTTVWEGLCEFLREMLSMSPLAVLVYIAEIIVQAIASGLMVFLSIAIGCTVANKHKVVTSVAFYFVLNTALQVISTVFIMLIGLFQAENIIFFSTSMYNVSTDAPSAFVTLLMGFSALFYAAIAVAEFFAINYIMKKKLNLA